MASVSLLPRIRHLSPQLANQIAAGEVVERPASVVKELLENSLDAGATQIDLDVERGGVGLIRVRDNGCGIHRDDLTLALAPHATSKVSSQRDLERVISLGFRGEALASIVSVARFALSSRARGEENAWRLRCDGGTGLSEPELVPHPDGSTVEVRELFFNTPARRKFLRAERTEFSHVEETVKRMALSRFDVGFMLRNDGRQIFKLRPAADVQARERRIAALLGGAFVGNSLALDYESAGLRLSGWVAVPEYSRSQTDIQYVFLNGRIVRDKLINHAVRHAYRELLPEGRHAAYVLYLQMDPAQVDVNVHPTKHEVRFRESRLVHDFVFQMVRKTVSDGPAALTQAAGTEPREDSELAPPVPGFRAAYPGRETPGRGVSEQMAAYRALHSGVRRMEQAPDSGPLGSPLGQLAGRYILAKDGDELVLIDGVAARRCVAYVRLRDSMAKGNILSQPLLVPVSMELRASVADALDGLAEMLGRLGFELDRLGKQTVAVRRIPASLRGADVQELVRATLDILVRAGSSGDEVLRVMARHTATEGEMTSAEHNELLRSIEKYQDCVSLDGRHVWRRLTSGDLDTLMSQTAKSD